MSESYNRVHALMVFGRDDLISWIDEFFGIDDSYVYHLTRVKSGFGLGTVTIDDFEEFTTEDTTSLADFLLGKLKTYE